MDYNLPIMAESSDVKARRRLTLFTIFLATIPCYCLGFLAIGVAPNSSDLTPTVTATWTSTLTVIDNTLFTPTISQTPVIITETITNTPTFTATQTFTLTASFTPSMTFTPSQTNTNQPTFTNTATQTQTPSPTPTVSPTITCLPGTCTDTPTPQGP